MLKKSISAAISKRGYKMAGSKNNGGIKETKCKWWIGYESNFWEMTLPDAPVVMQDYTEPMNPQELHWLGWAITNIRANVEYLYAKST